jgi:hypothetical protein
MCLNFGENNTKKVSIKALVIKDILFSNPHVLCTFQYKKYPQMILIDNQFWETLTQTSIQDRVKDDQCILVINQSMWILEEYVYLNYELKNPS